MSSHRDLGLVVVPVHDEGASIAAVASRLADRNPCCDLLFVDDGSRDRSGYILESAGYDVVHHPVNLGYLETLRTGLAIALDRGYGFVVFFDGDGQHRIDDLNKPNIKVITRIGSGQVDLAKKLLPQAKVITAEVIPGGEAQYLMTSQADATIVDAVSSPLLVKAAGNVKVKMIGKQGTVGTSPADADLIDPFDNGFGVAKGDPGFIACLNAWVEDGVKSGRFHERFVKWVEKLTK